jgi:type 1 fimbria pilin
MPSPARFTTLLCLALLCSASSAKAQNVVFGASGEVYRATCGFTVNDVDLGKFEARDFTGVGYQTEWQRFDIVSTGCTAAVTSVHMAWSGNPDANNADLYAMNGEMAGVGVEIRTLNNQVTRPGANIRNWPAGGIVGVYEHRARLVQTLPTVISGQGRTPVTVLISYN